MATIKGKKRGCSLKKDSKGWYVSTHRARSKSYASPDAIPEKDISFIESTGGSAFDGMEKLALNARVSKILRENPTGTAAGILAALLLAKSGHSLYTDLETPLTIEDKYEDLNSSKLRAHAIRTRFERELANIKGVDIKHSKVKVDRSMIPFRNVYDVTVDAHDSDNEPMYDPDSLLSPFMFSVRGNKNARGIVDAIAVNPAKTRQGIAKSIIDSSDRAFKSLGIKHISLNPAFDGPLVWSKPYFGFSISPKRKNDFLGAYKKYCKEVGVEFKDLGDKPSNYPEEFLKDFDRYSRWSLHLMEYEKRASYSKGIEKKAFTNPKAEEWWRHSRNRPYPGGKILNIDYDASEHAKDKAYSKQLKIDKTLRNKFVSKKEKNSEKAGLVGTGLLSSAIVGGAEALRKGGGKLTRAGMKSGLKGAGITAALIAPFGAMAYRKSIDSKVRSKLYRKHHEDYIEKYYKDNIEKKAFEIEYTKDKSFKGDHERVNLRDKDNSLAAYMITRPDPAKRKDTTAISSLYVDPKYRGKGLAKKLLDIAKSKHSNLVLRAKPFKDKALGTDALKGLYGKHGFIPDSGVSKKEKSSKDIMFYKKASTTWKRYLEKLKH